MTISMDVLRALLLCSSLLFTTAISTTLDTISSIQSIRGNNTLVSADGTFEFGFFSPGSSKNRYLGIWYNKLSVQTVVWVANRKTPLANSSGTLQLSDQGILVLLDHKESIIWSSNSTGLVQNPVAQLLDTGNLVVRDGNDTDTEIFIWQSFDYPSDTLLAGMKLGRDRVTGFDRFLTSWKSPEDPSPGNFTYRLEPNGYPQVILSQGSDIIFRLGPWNGYTFSGAPNLRANQFYSFDFVLNDTEMYYIFVLNSAFVSRGVLNSDGYYLRLMWIDWMHQWRVPSQNAEIDKCDTYAVCGAYGSCKVDDAPICKCLRGFVPKNGKQWDSTDWSAGCARKTGLDCRGDVFLKYSGLKLPDTRRSRYNTTMSLDECKMTCQKNCSCTAYTTLNIEAGSGCLLWFNDLTDIREYNENGQEIYVRMATASESDEAVSGNNQKKQVPIIIGSVATAMLILGLFLIWYILNKKRLKRKVFKGYKSDGDSISGSQKEDLELPLFNFKTVAAATNNFSVNNKLGEGGFGSVYKGTLKAGQEIAVKVLSSSSKQGFNEFKNEVVCIAKLQHRNLVKLLGCCIQEEKMLIYEYMPKKSLDFFIFDPTQRKLLTWQMRCHIINGIARGLLYLHQDSRLRVIHRDLKASNVLLDDEMNPKISDFGLAKSFGGNEIEANTNRVVGTIGYMSPEYAIDGIFSIKSDVFSYGVLLLETLAGKKNRGFHHADHSQNLLGHAWKLFNEDRSLELIDELVGKAYNISEASRLIHIGLLCVQRFPEDRPIMSSVVLMLSSEIALPEAKEPGFFTGREVYEADFSSGQRESCSTNEATMSVLSAR